MEKYYYDVRGVLNDECVEPCQVKDNGIMIGSCKCRDCEYCLESSNVTFSLDNWIQCIRIDEASLPN